LFPLGRTQQKADQFHVEDPVPMWMQAAPNCPQKANVWLCSFQQWYSCRLGCDYIFNSYRL